MNLNDVVTNTEKMLHHLISENINFTISLASDLGPVIMDPTQVEQLLMNLALNARDAMPDGGKLYIETANVTLKKWDVIHHPDVSPGEYVALTVSDSGIGISEDIIAPIFEPFFTTKEEGKGTGLGLSMCYGIVKQNGGHISVQSAVGQGSTFTIFIPRAESAVTPLGPEEDAKELLAGTETILLVEDDPLVRRLSVEVLSQQGYAVLEASDGVEALQLAQDHRCGIHLLLTDVVMPNMGIGELTSQLKAVCPNLKVLFTSGYADDAIVRQGVLEPEVEFMGKPFGPAELLNRVRQVLDK
jgi:CheY-like chemotaxis protein